MVASQSGPGLSGPSHSGPKNMRPERFVNKAIPAPTFPAQAISIRVAFLSTEATGRRYSIGFKT